MNSKLKTALVSLGGFILTSCGMKKQPLEGYGSVGEGSFGTEVKADDTRQHRIEDVLSKMSLETGEAAWRSIDTGELDPVSTSNVIDKFLAQNNIEKEKGDEQLVSVDWVFDAESDSQDSKPKGARLANPVYAKKDVILSNVENHGDVTIHRKEFKVKVPEIETICLTNVDPVNLNTEYITKVKKMVEDRNIEKSLHKGDTVEITKDAFDKSGFVKKAERAVVKKDGVSPTYENAEKVEYHTAFKLHFGYTYKGLEQ
ncbi:MAG: hypothetical protein VZR95_05635 [Alphaproteobacteria bacterium]